MDAISPLLASVRSPAPIALSPSRRRPSPRSPRYRVPELLRPVEVLNLLEITGSQRVTSQSLGLHQSSVSRTVQALRQQLQLAPGSCDGLRYGDAPSLGHLRQAVQAHRISGGWLRLAADPLHQILVRPGPGLLPGPSDWLGLERLAALVSHAVLDGGLVSSLAWESASDPAITSPPEVAGLAWACLAELPLRLVAPALTARTVLVPPASVAPGLHAELNRRGLALQVWSASGLTARSWLRRARTQGFALPLCPALLPPGWLVRHGWRLLPDQDPLPQRLWLLHGADLPLALQRRCNRRLGRRCAALIRSLSSPHPGAIDGFSAPIR